MNTHILHKMVTHLIQCSFNGVVESANCDVTTLTPKVPFSMGFEAAGTLDSFFRTLLVSQRPTIITIPRPWMCETWREMCNRKVLAPLSLIQNCDITPNPLSRKRPLLALDMFTTPTKQLKIETPTRKECQILLRRKPVKHMLIEYKCLNTKSSVQLRDVFQEIPQEKQEDKPLPQTDFMHSLNLVGKSGFTAQPQDEIKTSNHVKLINYHHIPFSSDYGRRLLLKNKHAVSEEVVFRKLERTERYVKELSYHNRERPLELDVTYDKKVKHYHKYAFPKRQVHQQHQSLKVALLKTIVRPLSVKVERSDLEALLKSQREKRLQNQVLAIEETNLPVAEENQNKTIPVMKEIEKQTDYLCNDTNGNFINICIGHKIMDSDNVSLSAVNDETINHIVLFCSCGEEITTPSSLPECTETPVLRKKRAFKKKVYTAGRKSLRLLNLVRE